MKIPFIHKTPGLLLQYIFASLLVLALAGFTHLSTVISYDINGNETYLMARALFSAFGNGLIVVFSVSVFNAWFENKQHPFWKYFWLNLCMLFLNFWLNYLLFVILILSNQIRENVNTSSWTAILYSLHPLIVGSLLMYFTDREQTRTRKISEQEYQLLQLQELKTKAELEALQAKINPHFLYNSLNSIASLVHIDPDRAEQMVLLLSRFFRYSTSIKN